MGNQSFISRWIKKIKHSDKHPFNKNDNDTCDREREKIDQFLDMINIYSNTKNKK